MLLARLEQEEREVSRRRRKLHDQIDFLRGGGRGHGPEVAAKLESLRQEEEEVSNRRRELHLQIDELRVKVGLPPGPRPRSTEGTIERRLG